jgi:DNA repair exonuclease SbcCD ATPase subunit
VDFVLTGRRPRDARLKSDWITRGENVGEVDLTFSNGARVVRNMSRKGSERLSYYPAGDPEHGAVQDAAQTKIDELLGLSRDDAPTWCFRQGEMSGLLRMDPGPRLEMFVAWFRLGKLEECQGMAADARGELEKRKAIHVQNAASAREILCATEARFSTPQQENEIGDLIAGTENALKKAQQVLEEERAKDQDGKERRDLTSKAARYDEVVKEGMALAERLKGCQYVPGLFYDREMLQKELGALRLVEDQANVRRRTLTQVAAGNFDGQCPVSGVPCPAKEFVTESVQRNRTQEDEARVAYQDAHMATQKVSLRIDDLERQIREVEQDENRLRMLRIQARELKSSRDRWAELRDEANRGTVMAAEHAVLDVVNRLAELKAARAICNDAVQRAIAADAEVRAIEKAAQIPSAAALIFEKARKKIAEDVLAEIEQHANDLLATVGVDLQVAVTWGRDGTGLQAACGACGASYPTSRKVRACARCGAERGPAVTERLDIEPSKRSGCADDFGGIAVALGASRWLREDRGSEWGVATLDEPTSAADATNRRAFASKLPELLRESGFSQALVVSHHRDTLATLPGRIEITAKGGVSTARVIA